MYTPKNEPGGVVTCPNGHRYSTKYTGITCEKCGAKLDYPDDLTDDELHAIAFVDIPRRACGWLVCIKGLDAGRTFEIRYGKNYIGRSSNMDIQIIGDRAILKENHAVIAYDGIAAAATILPGESQGMIYYKEKAIYEPTGLAAKDIITLGQSDLQFFPICDADFDWMKES